METVDPLERLYEQLDYFVSGVKKTRDRMPENLRTRHILQECLALRLSLLGICLSSMNLSIDRLTSGALILAQLIGFGVTEPESNQTLFFTCLDMLHSLVHNLAAQVGPDNTQYQNLAKKVRKKISDRHFTVGVEYIRPLLFTGRTGYPFVAVKPLHGTAGSGNRTDVGGGSGKLAGSSKFASYKTSGKSGGSGGSRYSGGGEGSGSSVGNGGNGSRASGAGGANGNSGSNNNGGGVKSLSRKRGYVFVSKERFAPWEIYDINRQSAFLAMCGAVQVPAILSRSEEQANLLLSHEHPITHRRSKEFYLQPLFHEAEPQVPTSVVAATAAPSPSSSSSSTSFDTGSKQFVLGPVPPTKRHPGVVEAMPRRMPQQVQRPPKPEDLLYRQQQRQQVSQPPQMRMQAPVKRKRSRAATAVTVTTQPQDEVLLPPPSQMYHQGVYTSAPQTSSAMAAAQAAESAAATTANMNPVAPMAPTSGPMGSGKRRRAGGMGGGGNAAMAAMRRGVGPPTSYDNGVVQSMGMPPPSQQQQHQQQPAWGRMPLSGAVGSVGGVAGRMPNQRQEFVQNRTKGAQKAAQQQQQQQMAAAAFAAGVMPMEEQFSQQLDSSRLVFKYLFLLRFELFIVILKLLCYIVTSSLQCTWS